MIYFVESLELWSSVVVAEATADVVVVVSSVGVEDAAFYISTSVDSISAAAAVSIEGLDGSITTSSSGLITGFNSDSGFDCEATPNRTNLLALASSTPPSPPSLDVLFDVSYCSAMIH